MYVNVPQEQITQPFFPGWFDDFNKSASKHALLST
jgi:hypothetical protein